MSSLAHQATFIVEGQLKGYNVELTDWRRKGELWEAKTQVNLPDGKVFSDFTLRVGVLSVPEYRLNGTFCWWKCCFELQLKQIMVVSLNV